MYAAAVSDAFAARALAIGHCEAVADRSGALYIACEQTLVVADLHLEKGSALALRGHMLPPYDTRETLRRLADALDRYAPRRVVCLGDSLHDRDAARRLDAADLATLRQMQSGRDWIWITGNHDPDIGPGLGGCTLDVLRVAGLTLRHDPTEAPDGPEVAGHLHPAARVSLGGAGLRSRCFIGDPMRLVMPAFGTFTGGLNILDATFAALFKPAGFDVNVVGRNGVYPVSRSSLAPD